MKPEDVEIIVNNQRLIMAAMVKVLKVAGAGKYEEIISMLDDRLLFLTERANR